MSTPWRVPVQSVLTSSAYSRTSSSDERLHADNLAGAAGDVRRAFTWL
ncbi:hypothetical protein OG609_00110 [Streptomyces sp. NBC_01224]|nr:hypothetical protein OG609_00110 [Streptomyces sp. NBC_01224]